MPLERAEEAPEGDVLLRLQELVREEEDGVLDQQVSDELGERGVGPRRQSKVRILKKVMKGLKGCRRARRERRSGTLTLASAAVALLRSMFLTSAPRAPASFVTVGC